MGTDGAVGRDGTGQPRSLAQSAIEAAVECEIATPAEVESGALRTEQLDHSSRVLRLSCGDRAWIAKRADDTEGLGKDWRAELTMYRTASIGSHTAVSPKLIGYSPRTQVLLIEDLDQNWTRLDRFDLRSPWSIEIIARVALNLARWQQSTSTASDIDTTNIALMASRALHDELPVDQALHESLRTVQNAWVASDVIHGDVRFDHVFSHEDGSVRMVSWGSSGWGDPRWDLAGLLQELHSAQVEAGIDTTAHRSAALSSYAERSASASDLMQNDPTLRAFVACRLVWRAFQLQQSPQTDPDRVNVLLAAAADHVTNGLGADKEFGDTS